MLSGDTKMVPQMIEVSRGCDLLIHEACNENLCRLAGLALRDKRLAAMNLEMQQYHTATEEVATIAHNAGVRNSFSRTWFRVSPDRSGRGNLHAWYGTNL